MKKKLLLICLLILSIFTITGCGNNPKIDKRVIGTWEHSDEALKAVYELKENGTGTYTITVGVNTVKKEVDFYTENGYLYINYDKEPDTYELEYTIKDNSLVVIDSLGEEVDYKKK